MKIYKYVCDAYDRNPASGANGPAHYRRERLYDNLENAVRHADKYHDGCEEEDLLTYSRIWELETNEDGYFVKETPVYYRHRDE